ncbi:putative SCO1 protein [Aeropyrum pernix]|uniref:Putative SCO1 protein n=1 Tax=Aeropyrum pernix TaxID=56636 RepID=A0A401HA70_AERPX|nr:SCO family protein [Aeropyrum pernix]GBF09307.1 putative SCO1 protein [Aeropyrum pernix]
MVSRRTAFIAVAAVLVAFAISVGVALIVASTVVTKLISNTSIASYNNYVAVIEYGKPLEPVEARSSEGIIRVPMEGVVNVVVPQYVNCPDVCHWESAIMIYLMGELVERGLQDKVVFVTIGVNPYYETLEDGKRYMESVAGDYLDKGVRWIWVLDDVEKQEELWNMFGIAVSLYCVKSDGSIINELTYDDYLKLEESGECSFVGVNHTAGFIIVDGDGVFRYFMSPTEDGWKRGQRQVAETILQYILKLVEERK